MEKKKSSFLIDLDKHVSVNTDLIPLRIICYVSSSLLRGKAKEAFSQLYRQPLSDSFFEKTLSEPSWRDEKKKQMPGGCSCLHHGIWSGLRQETRFPRAYQPPQTKATCPVCPGPAHTHPSSPACGSSTPSF